MKCKETICKFPAGENFQFEKCNDLNFDLIPDERKCLRRADEPKTL